MTIKVRNYCQNDSLNISLPLIEGEVIAANESKLFVQNLTFQSEIIIWPIISGKFKVLVSLIEGENKIKFEHKKSVFYLTLYYKPLNNKRFVRLVYIKCKDDDGLFQAPNGEKNSIQSACDRISLGARMLQTFTSDKLLEHNLERKTFRLEEKNNQVVCHVFTSSLSLKEAYKLNEQELWSHFAVELMNSSLRIGNNCKFLAFLSFTRYVNNTSLIPRTHEEVLGMTKGHVALGGGGLALFGLGCLHTWAQSISEIPWRFGDKRKIDRLKFMDDSANRGSYWACYSTTLGATLHELGHVFDLGHTDGGIMGRGFDDIYKYFIIDLFYCDHTYQKDYNPFFQRSSFQECSVPLSLTSPISWKEPLNNSLQNLNISNGEIPWSLPNPPEDFVTSGQLAVRVGGAYWCRASALILYFHKWFNEGDVETKGTLLLQGTKLSSLNGIKVIEFQDKTGTSFYHLEFLENDDVVEFDLTSLDSSKLFMNNGDEVLYVAEDKSGNIIKSKFSSDMFQLSKKL